MRLFQQTVALAQYNVYVKNLQILIKSIFNAVTYTFKQEANDQSRYMCN